MSKTLCMCTRDYICTEHDPNYVPPEIKPVSLDIGPTAADILRMVKLWAEEFAADRDRHLPGTHVRTAFAAKCAVLKDVARVIETGKVE